ncbi:hypothetical protein VTO73DRAFT_3606 [Trametes versicolor]
MGSVTASTLVAESFGDILDDFSQIRAANIAYLIPTAFVCYDYLLTSGREVQYIWRRGFSGPALLFYTLRYATLCNVFFAVTDIKPWANMSDHVVLVIVIVLGLAGPAIVLFTFTEMNVGTITLASSDVLACGYDNLLPDVVYEKGLTMVFLRDGTAYFLVLLIANLVGLSLIRQINLLEPASTWISALTAIMTWRFILDLHEADDTRRGSCATGSICGADTAATARSFSDLVFRTEAQSEGVFGVLIVGGETCVVEEDVHGSGEGVEAREPGVVCGDAHV